MSLAPNTLAFIALANEYCEALENISQFEDSKAFAKRLLRLLPRIYISVTDIPDDQELSYDFYLSEALTEKQYDAVSDSISSLLGEYDTFLEVFEEDMKYSDTPITASVSESLSDIYQTLYNFLATVKDSPEEIVSLAVSTEKEEFGNYWSATLCKVMRPLNNIYYNL